jgi:hypothetical protein
MNIKDLEIIKSALEGDIIRQKESEKAEHPAFISWLDDTEKLYKRVCNELIRQKAQVKILNQLKF